MPRKNRTQPHTYYDPSPLAHQAPKRAFRSKQEASRAIAELKKYQLDLELYTYRSPLDGKWYLSSHPQSQN